jgi:AraC family transcriptional regulator
MSEQPQSLGNNHTRFWDSEPIGSGPAKSAILSGNKLVAENGTLLAFKHLRITLAIAGLDSRELALEEQGLIPGARNLHSKAAQLQAEVHPKCIEIVTPRAVTTGRHEDPVIRSLYDVLAIAERTGDRHTGIGADALRFAIAIRSLGLQSESQRCLKRREAWKHDSSQRPVRSLQKWRLKLVDEYINGHLSDKVTLADLAAVAGLSRMHFACQFRAATGFRPHKYLLRRRINRAEELLLGSTMTIVDIALTVGFQSQSHFTTVFKRFTGHAPYRWRNRQYDERASA